MAAAPVTATPAAGESKRKDGVDTIGGGPDILRRELMMIAGDGGTFHERVCARGVCVVWTRV